jgi:hypothetical protein
VKSRTESIEKIRFNFLYSAVGVGVGADGVTFEFLPRGGTHKSDAALQHCAVCKCAYHKKLTYQ